MKPLPENAKIYGCGRPTPMTLREYFKWIFSPSYASRDGKREDIYKKYRDVYYIQASIYDDLRKEGK